MDAPPLPKICHTYSTIMNLGTVILHLKKFQKDYESHEIPLEFCWHFFTGNQQILLYQEIQIQISFRYKISNSSNFSWVFKSCFNKHGHILMMLAKKAAPSLLKLKIFWKKGYDVIFFALDITSPILSRDSNYNVNVVMWPKFSNCSTYVREAIIASIL